MVEFELKAHDNVIKYVLGIMSIGILKRFFIFHIHSLFQKNLHESCIYAPLPCIGFFFMQ